MTRAPLVSPLLLTGLLLTSLLLGLSGCAARPGSAALSPVAGDKAAPRRVTIYVATTRTPDPAAEVSFTSGRAREMNLARYEIAIPEGHKPANIEWPRKDGLYPERSFAVVRHERLTRQTFLDELAMPAPAPLDGGAPPDLLDLDKAPGLPLPTESKTSQPLPSAPPALAPARPGDLANGQPGGQADSQAAAPSTMPRPTVGIFVHGYNTNFPEALFRIAQLSADNPAPSRTVLFSWPSDGSLAGYVADKDAAAFSRDQLAELLSALALDRRLDRVNLAAHSMGCWLTMESLRQLRLSRQDQVLDRLGTVILAAPDIDVDVFRSQAQAVGKLDPPLTVLSSPDDRALFLSNRLGGERERLGSLDPRDPVIQRMAQDEGIQLIDISSMAGTDSLNHDRFVGAAATLQKLLAPKTTENPLRKAGAYVLDAAASVLEVPGKIGRTAAENFR